MSKSDEFEVNGIVSKSLRGGKFIVTLDKIEKEVLCTISGKLRQNYIQILVGDEVSVAMSPYDTTKGRIVWRNR